MKPKVLITDDLDPSFLQEMTSMGFEVDYRPEITYEICCEDIPEYEGLIVNSKINCNRAFLERAIKLKFIGRLGSGMEIIDTVEAAQRGIAVFNSPEGNALSVAEHSLGMLLSLLNNLCQANSEVKQFEWNREKNRGTELSGKTVGIIGFGHTGSSFAGLLRGFDCRVIAYDKYDQSRFVDFPNVVNSDLNELIQTSDVISLHVSKPIENSHLVNSDFLNNMKSGAILINTSRGNVVDTKSLIESLKSGQIGGAGLDVFENEKPATYTEEERSMYSNLYSLPNVILTPHIAGWTHESKKRISRVLIEKIKNHVTTQLY
jgi:D-3-phosphoglycerate dehydrogenase